MFMTGTYECKDSLFLHQHILLTTLNFLSVTTIILLFRIVLFCLSIHLWCVLLLSAIQIKNVDCVQRLSKLIIVVWSLNCLLFNLRDKIDGDDCPSTYCFCNGFIIKNTIENGNGKCVKETTTQSNSRKQPKATDDSQSRQSEKITHSEEGINWPQNIMCTSSKKMDVTPNLKKYFKIKSN